MCSKNPEKRVIFPTSAQCVESNNFKPHMMCRGRALVSHWFLILTWWVTQLSPVWRSYSVYNPTIWWLDLPFVMTVKSPFFPQTGLPVGFYLRKKETGHAGGRAVLCWLRIWPCWARWAGLGADLALLGALGWVGRGIWPCWACWAVGWVGFGSGGLGWVGCGFGFLCMVCIVHVFFTSSWCLCVSLHVYLKWYHGAWAKQSLAFVNETWFWAIPWSKSVMWSERHGREGRETAVAATNTA